jgi:hypothetical protein
VFNKSCISDLFPLLSSNSSGCSAWPLLPIYTTPALQQAAQLPHARPRSAAGAGAPPRPVLAGPAAIVACRALLRRGRSPPAPTSAPQVSQS